MVTRTVIMGLSILGLCVTMACVKGCDDAAQVTFLFVVPDGFKGPITIQEDPKAAPLPKSVNGQIAVSLPQDGALRVRSIKPFEQWHKLQARRTSGTALPVRGFDGDHDEMIMLRGGGTTSDGQVRYFVGTRAEHRSFDPNT